MKKFIKNGNDLLQFDITWLIYDNLSDVPNDLVNANVIVRNDGIYKCNGSTKTKIVNNRHNEKRRIGEVKLFYGNTIPNGWLECNGQTFSQSSYPLLYTYLGNSTTVPDYRELALGGTTSGNNWWYDRIGAHTHTISDTTHTHKADSDDGTWRENHSHTISTGVLISGTFYSGSSRQEYRASVSESTSNTYNVTSPSFVAETITPSVTGTVSGFPDYTEVGNVTRDRQIGVRFIICAQE